MVARIDEGEGCSSMGYFGEGLAIQVQDVLGLGQGFERDVSLFNQVLVDEAVICIRVY